MMPQAEALFTTAEALHADWAAVLRHAASRQHERWPAYCLLTGGYGVHSALSRWARR